MTKFREWRATQLFSVTDLPHIARYAWNAALEEAAKVADAIEDSMAEAIAERIRALKETG
jgi:hypothetical protein